MATGPPPMPAGEPGAPAVVIPALDAAATLPAVLRRLREVLPRARVIVVDDGSRDGTAAAAAAGGATVLRRPANLGKGGALAEGVGAAVGCGAGVVVTMDADGQHSPEYVPALLAALADGSADLVVGARRRGAGPMPWTRRVTNRLSSALVSRALGVRVPDSQSGFRAFTRRVAETVRPAGDRYEFETEFLFLAAHAGFRIAAVPVPTVYGGATSHFRYGADTWRLSRLFLRHWRAIAFGPRT
jgi:glycosyltransferase involved in cell wall biosynthesis